MAVVRNTLVDTYIQIDPCHEQVINLKNAQQNLKSHEDFMVYQWVYLVYKQSKKEFIKVFSCQENNFYTDTVDGEINREFFRRSYTILLKKRTVELTNRMTAGV